MADEAGLEWKVCMSGLGRLAREMGRCAAVVMRRDDCVG